MSIRLAEIAIDPPVLLAPMAGITDLPFRRIVARFGAGLVVSEMVASGELLTDRAATVARARSDLGIGDAAVSVQIAGREAGPMAEAARIVADMGAKIIDINMGCPAKKVTGGLSGAALMRNEDHALGLIEAVVGAVAVPVTLKMRLGWDEGAKNAASLAARAAAAGVRMVTVHGRTRAQFYTGQADWAAIAPVVAATPVPVVANGDITCAGTARAAREASGAAGVMVGRGALGAPWKLAEIARDLHGGPAPDIPKGDALSDLISEHYEAILGFYGRDLGLRVARKHLGWYADANGAPAEVRKALMTAATPAEVLRLVRSGFAGAASGRAAA